NAVLIPIANPNAVITGKSPVFDAAIKLDLGGLGIRDIACFEQTYVIIAGSWHGGGPFRIYFWDGPGATPTQVAVKHLGNDHPEAIVIYPHLGLKEIQILNDDGKLEIDGVKPQEITDPARKSFRSFWVVP